jgi:hypothetical protein
VLARRAAGSTGAARLAFVALLLYVVADFANPLMPGAVRFDPDDSVDGVGCARSSTIEPSTLAASAGAVASLPAPPPALAERRLQQARRVPAVPVAPRARAALAVLSDPSSDDA